jgi:hypothetical protein
LPVHRSKSLVRRLLRTLGSAHKIWHSAWRFILNIR